MFTKKTAKRRHKKRLPKKFDPNTPPDPERWLPLRERAAYKKKAKKLKEKEKEKIEKNAQGAVIDEPPVSSSNSVNNTQSQGKTEVSKPSQTGAKTAEQAKSAPAAKSQPKSQGKKHKK